MGLITVGKRITKRLLEPLGFKLVRTETLRGLSATEQANPPASDSPAGSVAAVSPKASSTEAAYQSSLEANQFRMTPRDDEASELVSKAYLTTLQRESAALRVQGDELVRLRRTVELLSSGRNGSNQASNSDEECGTRSQADGIYTPTYDFNGLRTDPYIVHNHDFMRDARFVRAYQRAVQATVIDHRYYWRVHVALWCASIALKLEGAFVECGVWKGFLSTAITSYFGWNDIDRKFSLSIPTAALMKLSWQTAN